MAKAERALHIRAHALPSFHFVFHLTFHLILSVQGRLEPILACSE